MDGEKASVELVTAGPAFDAHLYLPVGTPRLPPWAPFIANAFEEVSFQPLTAMGALLLVRLKSEGAPTFAYTFGTGRFLLRTDAWERAYGMRAALNIIFPASLTPAEAASSRLIAVDSKRHTVQTVRARHQATRHRVLDVLNHRGHSPSRAVLASRRRQLASAVRVRTMP